MASRKHPGNTRTRLNRERVLQAAVAFADEHGIGSLSMRKLGDALASRRCRCTTTWPTRTSSSTA